MDIILYFSNFSFSDENCAPSFGEYNVQYTGPLAMMYEKCEPSPYAVYVYTMDEFFKINTVINCV